MPGRGTPGGFVSTGHLPTEAEVERLVADTYRELRDLDEGAVSTVYPALARARRDLFGIALVSVGVGSSPKATPVSASRS